MTCPHLWTPSLEPRTVAHSWYQHAINEAAALDKEEEIYKAQSSEIKNRCKYAAIPGVFRIKHEDDEFLTEDVGDDDTEYEGEEDEEEDDDEEEDLDEEVEELDEGDISEEATMSYSIDRRRVNPVTPSLRANNNDPYLPVLTSEPSDISGLLLSSPPPISNSISSTERGNNNNNNSNEMISSGFSILRDDTYNNNHIANDLTDFLPRNNNLGLMSDVNYEVDIMDDIDLLQNDDLSFI
ncbi:hypothetical protein Glove_150g73 [Diversispora epigaea]|uniref:Uncharacterized protein n=1 Tax=Diversispora epigaea TaxID=1348612 RepID=A0A397IW43_9GLOM|nr:hypothetical protein Glove_150g73 [Diversispora epigaea]